MPAEDSRPASLADEAYAALRDRIVDCRLAPGLRVTEKQLAAELGVGHTPVRQALARLDNDGLVKTLPRRGYQITPLTIESVNELLSGLANPRPRHRGDRGPEHAGGELGPASHGVPRETELQTLSSLL